MWLRKKSQVLRTRKPTGLDAATTPAGPWWRQPVLSRTQLLDQVWGYTWDVDSNVVDVFVGYLRRKLEAEGAPRILQTVRGAGFVLRPTGDQ